MATILLVKLASFRDQHGREPSKHCLGWQRPCVMAKTVSERENSGADREEGGGRLAPGP